MLSMRARTFASTALLLTACAAVPAMAQIPASGGGAVGGGAASDHHFLRVGFGGGMSVPTEHAADAFKTGVNGEGFVLIDLGFLPPIRLNAGYQKFDYKQLVTGQTQGTTSILSGVGGLSITLIPFGPIRPYVTAGVGAFHISDSVATAAATQSGLPSTSAFKFGLDGGAGVRVKLGRLEAFAEGRVQNVYTDQGFINRKNITSVPVSFGILF